MMNLNKLKFFNLNLPSILFVVLCTSCAHNAWHLKQDPKGGVIGYFEKKIKTKKVLAMIPCIPYKVVKRERKSRKVDKVYASYISSSPITGGYGNSIHGSNSSNGSTYSPSTPIIDNQKEYWVELTYKCEPRK
jgi:hypothetical protein